MESFGLKLFFIIYLCRAHAELVWEVAPQPTVVVLGGDLLLHCRGRGGGLGQSLLYTWQHNGGPLQSHVLLFANQSLAVPNVRPPDLGLYTCTITTSPEGEVLTASVSVIQPYIEDFLLNPSPVRVNETDPVSLECVTGRSAPPPIIHWERNGEPFTGGTAFTTSYGSQDPHGLSSQMSMRLLTPGRLQDAGSFRCVARNSLLQKVIRSRAAEVIVDALPKAPALVTQLPEMVVLSESAPVMIPCLVSGHPTPVVTWYRNGQLVGSTDSQYQLTNGSLVLSQPGLSDIGQYWCQAANFMGNVSSNKTTLIFAKLESQFVEEPSNTFAFVGQNVTLRCSPPFSIPPAQVSWYKDFTLVVERGGRHAIRVGGREGEGHLQLISVLMEDRGSYYCVATNNFTQPSSYTSRTATLTIGGAPAITEPPIGKTVIRGQPLELSCLAVAEPPPTISWFLGDRLLRASDRIYLRNNNQELWVGSMGKTDEGEYRCQAVNIYGQSSASALVLVHVPPTVLQGVGEVAGREGETVLVPCQITGDPAPILDWFKDQMLVVRGPRHSLGSQGLTIANVTGADTGSYTCVGVSSVGRAQSQGSLTILTFPRIRTGIVDTSVAAGQAFTWTCVATGHPPPSLSWLHNGVPVKPASPLVTVNGTSLHLSSVQVSDQGNYTCVVNNSMGQVQQTATLKVLGGKGVGGGGGEGGGGGGRAGAEVQGGWLPPPQVTWLHGGALLTPSLDGRISLPDPSQVLVKFASSADAGVYTCRANNSVGSFEESTEVFVVEPPLPPVLVSVRPLSPQSVVLTWVARAQEPHTNLTGYFVQYRQSAGGGDFILHPTRPTAHASSWEVDGLQPGTAFVFAIAGANQAGRGKWSNVIGASTFQSAPSAVRNLQLVEVSMTTVTVAWEVPAAPNGNIRLYQLQYRNSQDSDFTRVNITTPIFPTEEHEIAELKPFQQYEVQVRAATIQDGVTLWGSYSETLRIQTRIGKPVGAPQDVTAAPLSATAISLQWQPVLTVLQNGPLTKYTVRYGRRFESTDTDTLQLSADQLQVNITGLSPFVWYSLSVRAENGAGEGPFSSAFFVRTVPAAPSAAPGGLRLQALYRASLTATWQPIPVEQQNSLLSGYILQFRPLGAEPWQEEVISSPTTVSHTIHGLGVWQDYEVRVAGFTSQVAEGRGPFSAWQRFRTAQAESSEVRLVRYNVTDISIELGWSPPLLPNGQLTGYLVQYLPHYDPGGGQTAVVVESTRVMLVPLHPNTTYRLSVAAVNGAGPGIPTTLILTTEPAEEVEEEISSVRDAEFEATSAGNRSDHDSSKAKSEQKLPVIVGGTLVGAIVVIIIIAFLIYRCIKRRRAGQERYMISVAGLRVSRLPDNDHRGILDAEGEGGTAMEVRGGDYSAQTSSTGKDRYGSFTSPDSPDGPEPGEAGGADLSAMQGSTRTASTSSTTAVNASTATTASASSTATASTSSTSSTQPRKKSFTSSLSHFGRKAHSDVYTIPTPSGIDNPGYVEDSSASQRPHSTSEAPLTYEEMYRRAARTPRKHRIASESAAAIAASRHGILVVPDSEQAGSPSSRLHSPRGLDSPSSVVFVSSDDQDKLLLNEVIYNERTAL